MPKRSRSGRGEKARARGGADQGEPGEVDLHRARRRPLADDEVELVVLHRRVEDLLHRRVEAVDLVDEEDVALLQVGEQRGEIAGLGDDGPRGGAETHPQLARHDLGERGLAEARRPCEQHVVQRIAPRLGGSDEHLEVGARLLLADELGKALRAQRRLGVVGVALAPGDESLVLRHGPLTCGCSWGESRRAQLARQGWLDDSRGLRARPGPPAVPVWAAHRPDAPCCQISARLRRPAAFGGCRPTRSPERPACSPRA